MTTTPTPAQQAGNIIHALLSQFEGDALGAAQNLFSTYFSNLKKSPTQANVVAQSLALAATAPLQLPSLETTAISQFADAGLALTALIPSVTTPPLPAAPVTPAA
jgi:hypothetical protein